MVVSEASRHQYIEVKTYRCGPSRWIENVLSVRCPNAHAHLVKCDLLSYRRRDRTAWKTSGRGSNKEMQLCYQRIRSARKVSKAVIRYYHL